MAITINTNFKVNAPDPIDDRLIVDRVDGTTGSLVSLTTGYNYRNMYVWVRSEKSFYYLIDSPPEGGATVSDWAQASGGVGATGCAKSGYVPGTSFTGSPIASASVTFTSPYSSASYSVVVTGEQIVPEYIYSVTDKTTTGFTIVIDTPVPIGATAMWITNCWDGSGLFNGGGGSSISSFLPLPVPKINLMQGTQEVDVYNSATNGIFATAAVIHNYPVLINMDFTSDHFSNPNNRIFIEMVHYRRKSKKTSITGPKNKGSSYVVPAKNLAGEGQDTVNLPWLSTGGFWSRGGNQGWREAATPPGIPLDPIGIDRPNHYEVTSYTMSTSNIWEYFTGRFEFWDVKYMNTTGGEVLLNTLIPSSGKHKASTNTPSSRFAYSSYYRPYYCAFRYIQWIPTANGGKGQIVSGPLSKIIKVTGYNFPFQTDYQQSAVLGFPVCSINPLWAATYNELKCSWVSSLP